MWKPAGALLLTVEQRAALEAANGQPITRIETYVAHHKSARPAVYVDGKGGDHSPQGASL